MREIEPDAKSRWDSKMNSNKEDLAIEDCEPNMLAGWTDKDPSVWDISEENNKLNLRDILIALCRNRDKNKKHWEKIAFLKFNKIAIDNAKVTLVPSNGNTGVPRIDTSNTHYELKNITGKQLCSLIYYIIEDKFETGLFKKSEYDQIVFEAYVNSYSTITSESSTYQMPQAELPVSGSLGGEKEVDKMLERTHGKEQTKTIASSSTDV